MDKLTVKICKHHGALTSEQIIKAGMSPSGAVQRYKCKQCMAIAHAKHFQTHKALVTAKTTKWRRANPERHKANQRRYQLKNLPIERARNKRYRENNKERLALREHLRKKYAMNTLADSYIMRLINTEGGLPASIVPKELLELKRVTLQIRRSIKHLKQEEKTSDNST